MLEQIKEFNMKKAKQEKKIVKAKAEKAVQKKASVKKLSKASTSGSKKKVQKKIVKKKRKFDFVKMVASGNDFIVFDNRRSGLKNGSELAASLCDRIHGIGADGLILIEKSRRAGADFKMKIFNSDGSEAEMCGNGMRCAVLFKGKRNVKIETLAGMLKGEITEDRIKLRMTQPKDFQINVNLNINGRIYQINHVNTGVPHSIYFVEDMDTTNVRMLGRLIRYHNHFEPQGTNVDFVKVIDEDNLKVRTYERGIEDETLACGTGTVASALIYHHKFIYTDGDFKINVETHSGERLKIYFSCKKGVYDDVWLEGSARIVYKGECYV